jgi:fructose-specific phosphotransferase system component IIB
MSRKLVATLSVAAVVALVPLSGAQATTSAPNMVVNPGFDSGLTSWFKDSSISALAVVPSAGSSGNGLKITATGAGAIGVNQALTTKSVAGATYVVTARLRAGSQTSTVNGGLVVRETRANGTRLSPGVSSSIKLVSSSFTTITYRYTAKYDGSALTVVARSTNVGKGEILNVDEWSVTTG